MDTPVKFLNVEPAVLSVVCLLDVTHTTVIVAVIVSIYLAAVLGLKDKVRRVKNELLRVKVTAMQMRVN